jgi:hypothetical protein|tara:strand:+ start:160 stop:417 length:258 start_codon:yes stop_codon:yes gene_type:complete
MKGVPHFLEDGTLYEGGSHKMPNGEVHTGKSHNKDSKKLFHFDDLSDEAKEKASKSKKENPKEKKGTAVMISFMDAVEDGLKKEK